MIYVYYTPVRRGRDIIIIIVYYANKAANIHTQVYTYKNTIKNILKIKIIKIIDMQNALICCLSLRQKTLDTIAPPFLVNNGLYNENYRKNSHCILPRLNTVIVIVSSI